MTTPRTPRGAKEKGDKGEAMVAAALTRLGFDCIDGKPTESGADLVVIRDGRLDHIAEVKARAITPNSMEPKVKAAMARRAARCRSRNWAYILYFIRDDQPTRALKFTVGGLIPSLKRRGLSLELYEAGFLDCAVPRDGPLKGLNPSPLPGADGGAVGLLDKPNGSREHGVAARPAMPEREHKAWCTGDEPESLYCMARDGPEA